MMHISRTTQIDFSSDVLEPVFRDAAENYSADILEKAVEFISAYFEPEDVFSEDTLEDWAKNNGFVEEE